jgi:hypothetical protein
VSITPEQREMLRGYAEGLEATLLGKLAREYIPLLLDALEAAERERAALAERVKRAAWELDHGDTTPSTVNAIRALAVLTEGDKTYTQAEATRRRAQTSE